MFLTRTVLFDRVSTFAQKRTVPLIAVCTAIIFAIDFTFPLGYAPWLPYFVLAYALSRLSQPKTLIVATAFWSLTIIGEPLLHFDGENLFVEALFNRTLGMFTLWILAGLLYTDIVARKALQQVEATLVQARLAAEAANQAKSDFLANMSHEMRTPLNAIMGITDILAHSSLSSEQMSLVRRCTKASDGLLRMIDDLLLAAKADSGTLELMAEPFVVRDFVTECTNLLLMQAQEKHLALTTQFDPTLPTLIVGDAHRLQQVLLNLLRNAIKFTDSGSITVRVASSPYNQEASHIQFSVADTGIGVPVEMRDRIFDRFAQTDSRSNRQHGGVGLGLSICKQLVELMGGRIWVEGGQSQGSTFSFTIPLKAAACVSSPPISDQITLKGHGATTADHGLKILLADDVIESQDIMRLYLRETAHQLDCVTTGTDAVSRFKTGVYDLVFMDLQMPVMDGYAATREIRAWETEQGCRRTPIIALTANGLMEARQQSQAAGCDDFLTKPIRMETILNAIGRYAASSSKTADAWVVGSKDEGAFIDNAVLQLIPKFIRNRRRDVTLLQTAIQEHNLDRIRTIGHCIKGLAGSYGFHEIGVIGDNIEQAALDRNLDRVSLEVSRLRDAVCAIEATNSAGSERHAA